MNPQTLIETLQAQDFDYWLDKMLDEVPETVDTREGSIIYDAMAPAATMLAENSLQEAEAVKQIYKSTAEGEALDWHATDSGTARQTATTAQVTAKFTDSNGEPIHNVEVSDQFASVSDDPIFYTVTTVNEDGTAVLTADVAGTDPNSYLGQILPVTPNDALSWAEIIEVSVPARDDEDDDHLRSRLLSPNSYIAYGGNVADYADMLAKITSVGAGQIYPTWQGGGTVKLVILDNDLLPASKELIKQVQSQIDPAPEDEGYGLAPIDHVVTVVAPEVLKINVTSTVSLSPDATLGVVTGKIQSGIETFFGKLREKWATLDSKTGRGYSLTVYRSQLLAEVMKIEGVVNASLPMLNSQEEDVSLIFTNELSQLPEVGEVMISE